MMAEHDQVLEKTISRDGTPIGYWRSGQGPALVLVHGTTADASRWEPCCHSWSLRHRLRRGPARPRR